MRWFTVYCYSSLCLQYSWINWSQLKIWKSQRCKAKEKITEEPDVISSLLRSKSILFAFDECIMTRWYFVALLRFYAIYFLLISRFILLKIGKIEYFWRFYAKKIIFHIFVVILQLISHYYIITEFSHVGKFSFLLLTLYLWFSRNIFVTL